MEKNSSFFKDDKKSEVSAVDYTRYNLLKATVSDAVSLCEKNNSPRFIGFLTEGESVYIESFLKGKPFFEDSLDENKKTVFECRLYKYSFFGGSINSARTMLGIFPAYFESEKIFEFMDLNAAAFPVEALTVYFRKQIKLTHRDFLGSLMALGIERDQVGDILTAEGYSVIFLNRKTAAYVKMQLDKVGREGVTVKEGIWEALPAAYEVKVLSGTVASLRLDSVVKLAVSGSRDDSSRLISAGLVSVNHLICENISHKVSSGNIISIRGKGRFKLSEVGKLTKKGRIFIEIHKYE